MIVRFFRSPRAFAHVRRPRLSRATRLALLVLTIAALAEVYLHTRQYVVRQPTRNLDEPFYTSCQEPAIDAPRENAAIVMLVRNSELEGALKTVHSLERHFNRWFHYPMVFLNDEPFSYDFQRAMNESASGGARFELIPKEEWSFPEWMDERAAKKSIAAQGRAGIMYAGMESYHHMCRFYSGKFYTLEALRDYKWYWRIEPDVDFYCSISYDPFVEMARHDKVYGFTISLVEGADTCPSLFRVVSDWKEKHRYRTTELWKAMLSPSWVPWPFRSMMSWLRARDSKGDSWSLCHYWSNFEIADLDFFRSQDYQGLFNHLDQTGGFYYERWGDAAVHSLALGMLLDPEKVHHFEDFGYRHDWFFQCPANARGGQRWESPLLGSDPTYTTWSPERSGGIGCRCECDGAVTRNMGNYCLDRLKKPTTKNPVVSPRGWF